MSKTKVDTVAPAAAVQNNTTPNSLYFTVTTFSADDGKPIGYRLVDQYHFGTRNWLMKHLWWAMINKHEVAVQVATDDEVAEYLAKAAKELQDKYSTDEQQAAA